MAEIRKNFLFEDGRRAERVVRDEEGCEGTKTIEVFVEPKIEMKLAQRVIEKRKPVVYEREIEHIDELTGEVVEKTVESMEPRANLQVVDRIVSAASLPVEADKPECTVSREELREDIKDAVTMMLGYMQSKDSVNAQSVAAPRVRALNVIEEKVENKSKTMNLGDWALLGFIGAQAAGLGWILFGM